MADETLLDKDELNIPSNLDNLKLYGVNSEQNTDGRVNASLLGQALGGQTGNVANSNYGDLPSVAFTETDDPQPLYDALNALPKQLVPHGKTYTFSTTRITATSETSFIADKRYYRFRTALTNGADAQGSYYGQGSGITLNASNMKFRRFEQHIITVENGVVTGTGAYNLGDIGTSSVAQAVNNSNETYTERNGIILVNATDGTTERYYIYNGSENVIGNGGAAVTDDDFTTVDPANSVPAASDLSIIPEYTFSAIDGSNQVYLLKDNVVVSTIDLTPYLDDTNLARITQGILDAQTGVVTFTRDDNSTFTIDLSELIDIQVQSDWDEASSSSPGFIQNKPENLSNFNDDIGAKDSRLPLSGYIDPINGDDSSGELETFSRPFLTLEGLLSSLPLTTGETYTIYFKGGVLKINKRINPRNLMFQSFENLKLDFTDVKEDDGVSSADFVLNGGDACNWTFLGSNISLQCDFIGYKTLGSGVRTTPVTYKGNLKDVRWSSSGGGQSRMVFGNDSDLFIENLYDSNQGGYLMNGIGDNAFVEINNFYSEFNIPGITSGGSLGLTTKINAIKQIGSNNYTLLLGALNKVIVGKITMNNVVRPNAESVNFNNTVLSNGVTIDFTGSKNVSGTVDSQNYGYCTATQNMTFENFNGKIKNFNVNSKSVKFINTNIETDGKFYTSARLEDTGQLRFIGYNTLKQNGVGDMFYPSNPLGLFHRVFLNIDGALVTNADTYGEFVITKYNSTTFKEKKGEVSIRSKKDLINKVLELTKTYIIDGEIELLADEYIEVPSGGNLTINGYGLEASKIKKNVTGESIFKSPVGGSGGLQMQGLSFTTTGQVFDLVDATGFNAIECNVVNFDGCNSLGELDNYRQFLGTTIGIYGCNDGFTLSGNWSGFKITNTNAFGFSATGTLFKAGTGLLFSSRFFAELNASLPTGAVLSDFAASNFNEDELFQLKDGQYSLNGSSDPIANTASLIPNITAKDSKTLWEQNVGLESSYKPFSRIKGEDGLYYELYIDSAGNIATRTV